MATMSEIQKVSIYSLEHYDENPRIGDVGAIVDSLAHHGQFKPIVVRQGTNVILAGNHVYDAMVDLHENGYHKDGVMVATGTYTTVECVFVDVDDEQAQAIMLADNATSDHGSYDSEMLSDILSSRQTLEGTGYDHAQAQRLMDQVLGDRADVTGPAALPTMDDEEEEMPAPQPRPAAPKKEPTSLDDFDDDEGQMVMLRNDVNFEFGEAPFDIPLLKMDMMLEDVPSDLITWAGRDATPDDGTSHYLYLMGSDSAAGLPWDRSFIGFYTHDDNFESLWEHAAYTVSKILSSGVQGAITPNYSLFTAGPDAMTLFNAFRGRWVGRYMQEAGIKVIPDYQPFRLDPWSIGVTCAGVPVGAPWASFQCQAISALGDEDAYAQAMEMIIQRQEPENLLVYGGNPARRIIDKLDLDALNVSRVHFIANRAEIRRGNVFDRIRQEAAGVDDFETMTGHVE